MTIVVHDESADGERAPPPPARTPIHAWQWWTALGVIATIALGVVQIFVSCRPRVADPGTRTVVQGTPASTVPTTAASAGTSPGTPAASPAGSVRWTGQISFIEGTHLAVDLDKVPPRRTDIDDEGDINAGSLDSMHDTYGSVSNYRDTSRIAKWTGAGVPDFATCRETALASGVNDVREVRVGTVLCVETSEKRYAMIKIASVLKFKGFTAEAVVWNA